MVRVAGAHGIAGASVARVTGEAHVSRTTFYELFEHREDCFLAALEASYDYLAACARDAGLASSGTWIEELRAGLVGLLVALDGEPELARLCIVHALTSGSEALRVRRRAIAPIVVFLDLGRTDPSAEVLVPASTATGVVGSVQEILHSHLTGPDAEQPLSSLANELMFLIVAPFLGMGAARDQLSRPLGPAAAGRQPGPPSPPAADESPLRLTELQHSALLFIAEHPGVSNTQIAAAIGVTHASQVSRLLGTLAAEGLIDVQRGGRANRWHVTHDGGGILEEARRSSQGSPAAPPSAANPQR